MSGKARSTPSPADGSSGTSWSTISITAARSPTPWACMDSPPRIFSRCAGPWREKEPAVLARSAREDHELPLRREIIGLPFRPNHLAYVDRVHWLLHGLCRWQLGPAHQQARCDDQCAALRANNESNACLLYRGS